MSTHASQGQEASEPFELAKLRIREKKYDEAEQLLNSCLEKSETAAIYRNLALIHRARGEQEKALDALSDALDLDQHDDAALALTGEIFFEKGDNRQAIGHYSLAIRENPEAPFYQQRFVELAGMVPFYKHNVLMQESLTACLKTPGIDCARAQVLWYTLLTCDPAFKELYKQSNSGSFTAFNSKAFDRVQDIKPLLSPFFLLGLKKIAVYHPVFEAFLTHLRLRLLEDFKAGAPKFGKDGLTQIAAALSLYCHYTEFIFDTTPEEDIFVRNAGKRIETGEGQDAALVALYACYAPLHGLKNAADLAQLHANGVLADTVALHVGEFTALAEARGGIKPVTDISAGVSQQVREQYEDFPYPRWKSFPRVLSDDSVEGRFIGKAAKILVAGCGTGMEPIQFATVYPDAKVLAVDLSLSSLSYAVNSAKRLGLSNVEFRHGDILNLGALGEQFDYVSSSGVLHHMQDPLAGWKVLTSLLKPDGLMRIGLYSETARRHLAVAQKLIIKQGIKGDTQGMRRFRRMMPELLPREAVMDILARGDYYHLSMFRDLLFHVQEHCFTIPKLQEALGANGLEFIKFFVPEPVAALYARKFPAGAAANDLANWHQFEQENPDTFSAMYQFWCRKKA